MLAVGAVICANWAAARLSLRFDLTEDRVYTLSPASRELIRALPDPVTIKAYLSRDLPPELESVARYTRELLEEYRLASGGKLCYQVEDPAADSRAEEQAGRCHIGKLAFQTKSNAKLAVGAYYLGLCIWYDGKSRALTPIERQAGLEYQISATIKRMSQTRRKVAFTVGHGERDLGTDYTFVKHALDPELDVMTLDPSTGAITDDIALLIVAGPRRPFDEAGRRRIKRFLSSGRPGIFLLDGAESQADGDGDGSRGDHQRVRPVTTGLEPLLQAYGFRVGQELVFDPRNVPGPVDLGAPGAPVFVNFPAFAAVRVDPALAAELPITAGVDAAIFPFASAVDLVGPLAGTTATTSAARIWTLGRTSPGSWRQIGAFSMATPPTGPADGAARGSAALAYAYQGPPHLGSGAGESASTTPTAPSVRLVVVGDSDFVTDRYMALLRTFPVYAGGAQLLLNAVSWALEDEALTVLRGHVLRARPLDLDRDTPGGDDGGAGRATAIEWANVAGVPLAVCAAGLLRWRWRSAARRRRQRLPDSAQERGARS